MAKTLIRIVTLALPYMAFVFGLSVLPSIALADDKLILAQKVELKNVDGNSTWVGVAKGPFTDSFPNGIDATGNVAAQAPGKPAPGTDLTQGRIPAGAVAEREFGSIGASQGSIIKNNAGKDVNSIQITTQGMTGGTDNAIDSKSTDGDDFNAMINGKTNHLHRQRREGAEEQPVYLDAHTRRAATRHGRQQDLQGEGNNCGFDPAAFARGPNGPRA